MSPEKQFVSEGLLPQPTVRQATPKQAAGSRFGTALVHGALVFFIIRLFFSVLGAYERTHPTGAEMALLMKGSCPAQVKPLDVGPNWVRPPSLDRPRLRSR